MEKSTDVREIAATNYLLKRMNCAEAVSKTVLEAGGCAPAVIDAVVAASCGFCGALAGGVMALSLLANGDSKLVRENSRQLHASFVEKHKVTCCRALGRGLAYGTPERKQYCSGLVRDVAELAVELARG